MTRILGRRLIISDGEIKKKPPETTPHPSMEFQTAMIRTSQHFIFEAELWRGV